MGYPSSGTDLAIRSISSIKSNMGGKTPDDIFYNPSSRILIILEGTQAVDHRMSAERKLATYRALVSGARNVPFD